MTSVMTPKKHVVVKDKKTPKTGRLNAQPLPSAPKTTPKNRSNPAKPSDMHARLLPQRITSRVSRRPSVVIVSNRLPISVKKDENGTLQFYPSVGGLATGLSSYVRDKRNKWIGWPGIPSDQITEEERKQIAEELLKHNCYPVFLKQKQLDDFYNGYSNSILWPLFHDLPADTTDEGRFWKAYKAVNTIFGDAVLALSENNSTIWVHDYQLLLLPAQLRAARPNAKIGFFLHIPFPSPKNFKRLSAAKVLLAGMLGSDLVGLHTKAYVESFMKVTSELTSDVVERGQVILGDRVARVTDFPMGIDYERFTRARDLQTVKSELKKHQRKYKGMKVILTVDRIDPTKGLVQRLEAYYEFLKQSPKLHGKVVMAMLAIPNRTDIQEYKQLIIKVESLVEKINTQFGTRKWQPVDFMTKALPVESVSALYQVADVAFITPIRDGMNLVAKEFIASKPKHNGVLILSETAGAAQELQDALLVNPRKPETLVAALEKALSMPKRELKQRLSTMHQQISTHTVQYWAKSFMGTLQKPIPGTTRITRALTRDREQDLVDSFRAAKKRLILLDYDGVLVSIADHPKNAKPPQSLLKLLKKLSTQPSTEVAVISGRGKDDLEEWLGGLGVTLIAEHGAYVRLAGRKRWQQSIDAPTEWQNDAELILEKYAAKTPGAFVERKDNALVWHYRKASPYYAQKYLVVLKRLLYKIALANGLEVRNGNKILEIKPASVNKGVAARNMYESQPDFVLAMGDDYTDEDMFEALPYSAYTIRVGRGPTLARYRLPDVDRVYSLLNKLAR